MIADLVVLCSCAEGGVSLQVDVMLFTQLDQFYLHQMWMALDLKLQQEQISKGVHTDQIYHCTD